MMKKVEVYIRPIAIHTERTTEGDLHSYVGAAETRPAADPLSVVPVGERAADGGGAMTDDNAAVDRAAYLHAMDRINRLTMSDIDIDAYADGITAHRNGLAFHDNPHREQFDSLKRLSWTLGWNERALRSLR